METTLLTLKRRQSHGSVNCIACPLCSTMPSATVHPLPPSVAVALASSSTTAWAPLTQSVVLLWLPSASSGTSQQGSNHPFLSGLHPFMIARCPLPRPTIRDADQLPGCAMNLTSWPWLTTTSLASLADALGPQRCLHDGRVSHSHQSAVLWLRRPLSSAGCVIYLLYHKMSCRPVSSPTASVLEVDRVDT